MSTAIQRRRGTTAQHASFAGLNGELTVDTDKKTVVVHDGATAGGFPLARQDFSNVSSLALPAGAAATPVYSFTGDTNTGIYSPGADQVAISTGGSGRLFVDASGNVGVGASSSTPFGVTASNFPLAAFKNTSASTANSINFLNNADVGLNFITYGSTYAGGSFLSVGASGSALSATNDLAVNGGSTLRLGTANTERLRITSAGLVGIGTSTPSVGLHVSGATNTAAQIRSSNTTNSVDTVLVSETNGVLRTNTNHSLALGTNSTTALTIDTSQRVGIGTTTPGGVLEAGAVSGSVTSGDLLVTTGSTTARVTVGRLSGTTNDNTSFRVRNRVDSTLFQVDTTAVTFGPTGTEAARIDSSGRLLVGTSSSYGVGSTAQAKFQASDTTSNIHASFTDWSTADSGGIIVLGKAKGGSAGNYTIVANGNVLGEIRFAGADGTDLETNGASIRAEVDGTPGSNDMPGRLVFSTTADGASSPTERMRIQSDGVARFTTDGSYTGVDTNSHAVRTAITGTWVIDTFHAGASANGIHVEYGTTPNGANNHFFYADDATAKRFTVRSNGGIENYQANDANLCDEREKKNIEDLDSTWDCLKHWELKKFHYNEDSDTEDKKYGIIAQQIASHCPEVITDWVKQKAKDAVLDEDGNVVTPAKEEIVRMGVKEQQMYWMAIKALQEAQVRIEALEAEVAALKAQ